MDEQVKAALEEIEKYLDALVKSRVIALNIERKVRAKIEQVKSAIKESA